MSTSSAPTNITLLGATGLTGSATLRTLLASPSLPFSIRTYTRSAPSVPAPVLPETSHANTTHADLRTATSAPLATKGGVYVTCLGTTRGSAGGSDKQREIDLVLNRDLAKRAREDGASVAILVSSGGANASSYFPYMQMKGQLEEELKEMDFDKTVILRPGLLMGDRQEQRIPEYLTRKLFGGFRMVGLPVSGYCIDDADVGACIAYLATHPPAEKVVTVDNTEMLAYARKWREL